MNVLKDIFKKKTLLVLTIAVVSSTIFGSLSNFFIRDQKIPALQVNQEPISSEIIKLNFKTEEKKHNKEMQGKLFNLLNKNTYQEYLKKNVIIKIINESLIKQYAQKLKFNISEAYTKSKMLFFKYFQKNNRFNYKKYLNFINSIKYTHQQYLSALKKKISGNYFIKTLLKSIIILKKEIKKKFTCLIERKNFQNIDFQVNVHEPEKQKINKQIKKYFHENKKQFYTPESIKINIACLKKTCLTNNKVIDNNIKKYYSKKLKKYISNVQYKYSYIKTNSLKLAKIFSKHNYKKKLSQLKLKNKPNQVNKIFNIQHLGWTNKDNLPFFIKRLNMYKKNSFSKIIFYKNNLFVIKLEDVKKPDTTRLNTLFNSNIKKIRDNGVLFNEMFDSKKQPYFFKKNIKLNKLLPQQFVQINTTHPLNYKNVNHYSRSKKFNQFIKKIFFHKKIINKDPLIKIYTNNNKHIYFVQIHSYQPKRIEKKDIIYKKILNILKFKNLCNQKYKCIKNFFLTPKNKKKNYLSKHLYYPHNTQTTSFEKNKEIMQIIHKLPKIKKNQYIYFLLPEKNKPNKLIIYKKEFLKKINTSKKYEIIQKIKKYLKTKIISSMVKNLYKKSKILYSPTENLELV